MPNLNLKTFSLHGSIRAACSLPGTVSANPVFCFRVVPVAPAVRRLPRGAAAGRVPVVREAQAPSEPSLGMKALSFLRARVGNLQKCVSKPKRPLGTRPGGCLSLWGSPSHSGYHSAELQKRPGWFQQLNGVHLPRGPPSGGPPVQAVFRLGVAVSLSPFLGLRAVAHRLLETITSGTLPMQLQRVRV